MTTFIESSQSSYSAVYCMRVSSRHAGAASWAVASVGAKVAVTVLADLGSRCPAEGEKVSPSTLCQLNLRAVLERLRSVKEIVLDWPMATSPNLRLSAWFASTSASSPSSAAGRSSMATSCVGGRIGVRVRGWG